MNTNEMHAISSQLREGDPDVRKLNRLRLDEYPLPVVHPHDTKQERGSAFAIGGSELVPGAILLSGIAALRAGAGKIQIATVKSASAALAVTLPESLVIPLPSRGGEIASLASVSLQEKLLRANAVLIGPGMLNLERAATIVDALYALLPDGTPVVLDGAAIASLGNVDAPAGRTRNPLIITPHVGEMSTLLEIPVEEIEDNLPVVASHAAREFGCHVVLKGVETCIAQPDGAVLQYRDGKPGLGVSGSGDVLAGLIVGLLARGADPLTAVAWAVYAHGTAGNKLSRTVGHVGFLASELLPLLPGILTD
ncbi:MAG: NAD(P)H-hydrate dehydratase [Gemmatimonas sp.]